MNRYMLGAVVYDFLATKAGKGKFYLYHDDVYDIEEGDMVVVTIERGKVEKVEDPCID